MGGACGANIPITFNKYMQKLSDYGLNLQQESKSKTLKLANKDGSEYLYFKPNGNGGSTACDVKVPMQDGKPIPDAKPQETCGKDLAKQQQLNGGAYAMEFNLPEDSHAQNPKTAFIVYDSQGNLDIQLAGNDGKPDPSQSLVLNDKSNLQDKSHKLNARIVQKPSTGTDLASVTASRDTDSIGGAAGRDQCNSVEMDGTGNVTATADGKFHSSGSSPNAAPGANSSNTYQAQNAQDASGQRISSQANTAQ